MQVKAIICLVIIVMLGFAACSQRASSPKLPQALQLFSDAIIPVKFQMQRFAMDANGQAYGTAGKNSTELILLAIT